MSKKSDEIIKKFKTLKVIEAKIIAENNKQTGYLEKQLEQQQKYDLFVEKTDGLKPGETSRTENKDGFVEEVIIAGKSKDDQACAKIERYYGDVKEDDFGIVTTYIARLEDGVYIAAHHYGPYPTFYTVNKYDESTQTSSLVIEHKGEDIPKEFEAISTLVDSITAAANNDQQPE